MANVIGFTSGKRRSWVRLLTLGFVLGLAGNGKTADQPPKQNLLQTGKFEGVSQCTSCHTRPMPDQVDQGALKLVLLTEYTTWKALDKHAQAYAVVVGPRGKQMLQRLGKDVKDVQDAELRRTLQATGCLSCHAMDYPGRQATSFKIEDGVSCAGCHGPSEGWLEPHIKPETWRQKPPGEKEDLGMRDLRNPVKRAELCVSCHIGNAAEGKVVTHAMFAAGHPPLPSIDVALFSQNLPQHWRDQKDVPYLENTPEKIREQFHYRPGEMQQTRIALVGNVVALRDLMRLVEERADVQAVTPPAWVWPELFEDRSKAHAAPADREIVLERWPELALAHSDCYACHHELQIPSWRQERVSGFRLPDGRVIQGRRGRPQVRPWPMALIELAVRHTAKDDATARKIFDELHENLGELCRACNQQPYGNPAQVRTAAGKVRQWSERLLKAVVAAPYDQKAAARMLRAICSLRSADLADYETARQIASILKEVYAERAAKSTNEDARKILKDLEDSLNLKPYSERKQRLEIVQKIVEKVGGEKITDMRDYATSLDDLANKELLNRLAKNEFLKAFRDVGNQRFNREIQAYIDQLQELDDHELKTALEKARVYDPYQFRKQLQDFKKLFPAP